MTYKNEKVNNITPDSSNNIELKIVDLISDTPSSGETITGLSNSYDFNTISTSNTTTLDEYFYVQNTTTSGNYGVTAYGWVTQYIDNRGAPVTLVSNDIGTTATAPEVQYASGNSRVTAQVYIPAGNYFFEHHPNPSWNSSSGYSQLKWSPGSSSSASVSGNYSYCSYNSPSRAFYAIASHSAGSNQFVYPVVTANAAQTIGGSTINSQAIAVYRLN